MHYICRNKRQMYKIAFRDLPYRPGTKDVIYIENEYDKDINHFLSVNYDRIRFIFWSHGLSFIYLPIDYKEYNIIDKIRYYAPYLKVDDSFQQLVKSNILLYLLCDEYKKEDVKPSLIFKAQGTDGRWIFDQIEFEADLDRIEETAKTISELFPKSKPKLRLCYRPERQFAADEDNLFENDESVKIIKDLEETVGKLRLNGYSLLAIHEIIDKQESLSSMHITSDYRIFLPEYNNIEIEMGALPKALYFLFLRYPEGLVFKQLIDHQKELLNIYRQLRPSTSEKILQSSIAKIVEPFGNAINENVARIRKAFVEKFDERLAKNYIITGTKGESYKIALNRDIVIWEE